jgi:hypothetical protein
MKKNIGKTDSVIRLIFITILIISYFAFNLKDLLGLIVLGIAFLLCLTVITGVCPLYYPFGFSSREKQENK